VIRFLGYEKIPLDQLETFPGNPNIGDVKRILESLRANGAFRSLIVRKHSGRYTVMAGNHTKLAMVEHGAGDCGTQDCVLCPWDGAPRCELYQCDDDDAIKVNLADNRSHEFSRRDDQAVAELLLPLEDLTGSLYTMDDLRLFLPQDPPTLEELNDEYDEPETEDAPVWPRLSFRVPPTARDLFLELTEGANDPSDPVSRFLFLLSKASS
jgi:hypothetical protein